jgi:hypothetical protein
MDYCDHDKGRKRKIHHVSNGMPETYKLESTGFTMCHYGHRIPMLQHYLGTNELTLFVYVHLFWKK